jgi:N-acetylglucosaminyl-diphospho-decaprenol L-rhamnosyltransferase
MPPHLAAVIVTYNSAHVVGNLLDSLPAALDGLSADVIVVDNDSADDTVSVLQARGDCRIVRSANIGYAGGINLGVRESPDAPAILILNPDVVLHPKSVPPLLAALDQPGIGIVAPQVRSEHGGLELSLRREPTILRALGLTKTKLPVFSEYVAQPAAYESPRPVDWATGAVLAMSRSCFDALGGWDESFFLYSEEVDVSLRARDAGLVTWYEPKAVATHIGGQSGRNDTTHTMQIVNRVRLYRRRHRGFASWCYYTLAVVSELSRIPRGHAESRAAVLALLKPARRPSVLRCSDRLVPR